MVVLNTLVGAELPNPLGHSAVGSCSLVDNTAEAMLWENAGGENWLLIATTNGSERITWGNASENPDYTWLGSGDWTVGGSVGTSGYFLRSNGAGAAPSWAAVSVTDISLVDNTGNAFRIIEGANVYMQINTTNGGEQILFGNSTSNPEYAFTGKTAFVDQINQTSGFAPAFYVRCGSHTTLTASTECRDVYFDLSRTVQFATGALATQRAFHIDAPTYAFVGASVITDAITLDIGTAPVAGTNATLTNAYALRVAGNARFNGGITAPGSSGFSEVYGRGASGSGNFITVLGYNSSSTAGTALGPNCALSTGSENIGINAGGSACTITGSNSLIISPGGVGTVSHTRAYLIGDSLTSTANDQTQIRTLSVILGEGDEDASPPSNVTMRVTNAPSGNTAAGNYTLVSGRGRGSGAGGHLIFQTAPGIASSGTLNTAITRLEVEDTGQVNVSGAANGQSLQFMHVTESHTLAAAATSDTTINLPANAYVYFVSIRVTTLITGCTTLDVGIAGDTTRYGTGIALTAGTTNPGIDTGGPRPYAAATAIRLSAIGGGASFTAGVVRVTAYYATTVVASS